MSTESFVLVKATPALEDDDGAFTAEGMRVMHAYASAWVGGVRDLQLERMHPEFAGPFYDVRVDADLAAEHALPLVEDSPLEKALQAYGTPKPKVSKTPVTFVALG